MRSLWLIPVGGAVLAPLITWFPMLALRYPGLGFTQYPPAIGIDFWGMQALWLTLLAFLGALIATRDRYFGIAVALGGLVIFWRGAALDPTHTVLFALGGVLLLGLRRAPAISHRNIAATLAALGAFQVAYILTQLAGYDLLWAQLWGLQTLSLVQPLGTLGTVDAAGAYIAITAPLMPVWLLPFAAWAVWSGHSLSALSAFAAGLTLRYVRRGRLGALIIALGGLTFLGMAYLKGLHGVLVRASIWSFGLELSMKTDPVLGWGLGGWSQRVPVYQTQHRYFPTPEVWREAHNEPVQWIAETGVIGLALLAGWLWTHRAMFRQPLWGPSVTALGVNTLGFFPFHVVPLALLGLIVVGLALADSSTPHTVGG